MKKEKYWKFDEEKNLPTPGVEPGPSGWKPDILAVRPRGIMFPSGIEPETFCVLGRCDNRYTTETCCLTLVGDGSSSSAVDLQSWCKYYFFLSALVSSRDRLVVRTLRCGRSNPGSNPGHGSDILICLHCGGWMTQNDIYLFHFSLVQNLPFTCRSFSYEMPIFNHRLQLSVGGIVVSIAAFQAVDPGSIPGHRKLNFF